MKSYESQTPQACVSCGQALAGKFCSNCGEKVLHPHDRTIGHFFHEFIHGLTHADGKFLRSLKYLSTRPGFLTSEFVLGRRKLYSSPLSLFLIASLIYLMIPSIDALNSTYRIQVDGIPYSPHKGEMARAKMQQRNWTDVQMEEAYNHKTDKVSKVLLVLIVLMFSLPVAAVFYNKRSYYADHLAFSTEFLNFVILGLLLLIPFGIGLVFFVLRKAFHLRVGFNISTTGTLIAISLVWLYLSIAAKRVYGQPWVLTLCKTLLLTICFAACVLAYRYILFYAVMSML